MREWIQNYGAMAAAGVAATLSLLSLVVNLRSRRREWLREKRLMSYSELGAASTLFTKTLQRSMYSKESLEGTDTLQLAQEVTANDARFEGALAAVLILGPKEVGRVAALLYDVIEPLFDAVYSAPGKEPDLSSFQENFSRVMTAFIEAGTKALGEKHSQEDVNLDRWLSLGTPPRASWP